MILITLLFIFVLVIFVLVILISSPSNINFRLTQVLIPPFRPRILELNW